MTARKRWISAWTGAAALGVANGASREAFYADAAGEEAAHVISTGTLLALLSGYTWLLQRRWPLRTRREALSVGAAWAIMTVGFEFCFGHWVGGDSWPETAGELRRERRESLDTRATWDGGRSRTRATPDRIRATSSPTHMGGIAASPSQRWIPWASRPDLGANPSSARRPVLRK